MHPLFLTSFLASTLQHLSNGLPEVTSSISVDRLSLQMPLSPVVPYYMFLPVRK